MSASPPPPATESAEACPSHPHRPHEHNRKGGTCRQSSSLQGQQDVRRDLRLALRLSHEAGAELLRAWRLHPNDRPRFTTKSSEADVVTETDRLCERIVQQGIRSAYPHHRFLGEESHATEGEYPVPAATSAAITWIVDPVDGTNNFVHQLPAVAVSIGVMRGREVIAGVVHRPVSGETYFATKNGGAFKAEVGTDAQMQSSTQEGISALLRSAERLRVSQVRSLTAACLSTEVGYSRSSALVELMVGKLRVFLSQQVQSLRMAGSCCCDMLDVAAGRMDAYYEGINTFVGPKPWDVTAASLIVTEAGGVLLDIDGEEFSIWSGRVLVAATTELAQAVVAALKQATQEWVQRYPEEAHQVQYNKDAGIAQIRSDSPSNSKL